QNPENAVKITLYREPEARGGQPFPPSLDVTSMPVDGEGTQVFWLDLWVEKDAPVRRIQVEPELLIDDDWVIYPIEGRVMDAAVPPLSMPGGTARPMDMMRELACGTPAAGANGAANPDGRAHLAFRNGMQDIGLAQQMPK